MLSRFLKSSVNEVGVVPLIAGLNSWVSAHANSSQCFDYVLPGELFSERKPEFTEKFCLLLCHFGSLVNIVDKDFNDCAFVWRYHAHFSDKYAIRVCRKIARTILNQNTRNVKHNPGDIVKSTVCRENIDGKNDSLFSYTVNALLCPIL